MRHTAPLTLRVTCPSAIDPARAVRDIVTCTGGSVKRLSVRPAAVRGQSMVVVVFRPQSLTSAAETLSALTELGEIAFEHAPKAPRRNDPANFPPPAEDFTTQTAASP